MSADGSLHRYFLANGQKRLHKWLHYFDIYERHFERFRGKSPVVIEIGVMGGGSLAMWKNYFGPGAKIVGVDIDPTCKEHEAEDIEIFIGSQDDPNIIDAIVNKYGSPNVVIDDGSHNSKHMIATFKLLYKHVNQTGVYLVEDTHTNYWNGPDRSKSFMEFSKTLIDEINAYLSKGTVPITEVSRSTDGITFYDSIVVFERRPQGVRKHLVTIGMELG